MLDLSKPNAPEEVIEEKNFRELLGALAAESNVVSIPFRLRSVIDQIGFSESPDDVFIMALQKNCAIPTVCFRQLQPTTNSISAGVLEFCNFVQHHTGDEELGTRIELLLSEFLNNVVLHGLVNAKRGKAVIAVRLEVQEEKIVISAMDRGREWEDVPASNVHTARQQLEELNANRATSGRGLAIITSIAESIRRKHYRGLNETVFIIRR